jgi:hypothetical protein
MTTASVTTINDELLAEIASCAFTASDLRLAETMSMADELRTK